MRIGTRVFSSINIKSIIFGSIIILACLAFIFTGFGSLHVGNLGSMNPSTAAMVDSLSIDMTEFVNFMNEQGLANVSGPQKKYVASQLIKQLITQKILANEALKIGWQVSDNEIASAIKAVPLFQDPSTHQFSLELFKRYIASQQTSEIDFYNYLRTQLNIQKMQNLIFMPIVIPNSVAKLQYDINNTQFNLQYAIIGIPEKVIQQKIEEKAKKFVEDKANIKQLENLYATQKDQFNQKAKSRVRSILISYKGANRAQGDALNRTKEEAQKLIQQLLTQIQHGENFANIASQTNDDTIAKQKQGDLGFVDDMSVDPVSLKSISLLTKQNPLSNVADTPFGYRIFQYEDTKPAVNKSFEDAKLELAKQIISNQIRNEEENNLQIKLSDALSSKNITQINMLLANNEISWQYLSKPFKVTDANITELGSSSHLSEEIFTLKKSGDIVHKIIDFNPKKALIKLDTIIEPSSPSQTELDSTRKQMVTEQSQLFAQSTNQLLGKTYEEKGKIKINPIIVQ